jgi:hypothetical protein
MATKAYDGPAVIIQGARRVKVICMILLSTDSWRGTFRSAIPPLGPDVHYVKDIELPDGRTAKILFTEIEKDRRSGRFRGFGPSPV